jgi:hypothetical protein
VALAPAQLAHRDQRAALPPGLDHQSAERQATDDPVAYREELRDWPCTDRELAHILTTPRDIPLFGASHSIRLDGLAHGMRLLPRAHAKLSMICCRIVIL